MRIALLPVDGRPCTMSFPIEIASLAGHQVTTLSEGDLGFLKHPADVECIQSWLLTQRDAEGFILSADMLVYGGLVPSRVGHEPVELLRSRMSIVRKIKQFQPDCPIYVFSSIMRMANTNVADEEPDYWADHGVKIFRMSLLQDRVLQMVASDAEQIELRGLKTEIPESYLSDVLSRRQRNFEINQEWLSFVEENIIDLLIFPLDDISAYGWNVEEQRKLRSEIRERQLDSKVLMYPGADEVAQTLLARMLNRNKQKTPRVFPFYSSTKGPFIHAKYEDRPIGESVKGQIYAAGGRVVFTPQDADIILAVNTPGDAQGEIVLGYDMQRVDNAGRNLQEFTDQIASFLQQGQHVAIADLAYANGADQAFIRILQRTVRLRSLSGFAAWNTTGNTLGTVIAHSFQSLDPALDKRLHDSFLLKRFIDDYLYESIVRMELYGESAERTCADDSLLELKVRDRLKAAIAAFASEWLEAYDLSIDDIFLPWRRLFEVGIHLTLTQKASFE